MLEPRRFMVAIPTYSYKCNSNTDHSFINHHLFHQTSKSFLNDKLPHDQFKGYKFAQVVLTDSIIAKALIQNIHC